MELLKAVFGLITGLAWPFAVVLIVWWFQEEIAELIRRGFKFKGFGGEGLNLLMERATTDPRDSIKRSWELLGGSVLRAAKVPVENVEPNSEEISTSLKRLEADTRLPEGSVRSIRNLQEIARKVFYQSQWAYDPSPKEAEEFVLYSAAARNDLGEKVQ